MPAKGGSAYGGKNNFYITTTLAYVNSEPHIGFAGEVIIADALARFHRALGDEVFFNTGTDEHGLKIYRKAEESGIDVQAYCDELAKIYIGLRESLNLSSDNFIRTTDKNHIEAVQEFWKRCKANGDIYKKMYKVKYCVGCELEKTDSELVDGKCPLHPNQDVECIEEENYFFKFSSYQQRLLDLYEKNPDFVLPGKRLNEIKSFVERGLEDFSISRMKEKMPWGIEVPGDPEHVIYVWFDALVNYVSTLGWPKDTEKFEKFWPVIQIAGKDNLRQQSAMWQAMLFSAGIPNSKQIFIRGFITNKGEKMSKSQGNFIGAKEMIDKFGVDGTRYLLLSIGGAFGEDTDVTMDKFVEKYNADLANGLGNLVSRVIKLADNLTFQSALPAGEFPISNDQISKFIDSMELSQALNYIWNIIQEDNKFIEDNKPWELAKNDENKFREVMEKLYLDLYTISNYLAPFMPETAKKIKTALENKKTEPLFQRIK
jgi:methionyl-tRNA synthetase